VKDARVAYFRHAERKSFGACDAYRWLVTGAHAPTFVALDLLHAKDRAHVYIGTYHRGASQLTSADASSFRVLPIEGQPDGFGIDARRVWYGTTALTRADPATFVVLR
jgi:hypothetical protein